MEEGEVPTPYGTPYPTWQTTIAAKPAIVQRQKSSLRKNSTRRGSSALNLLTGSDVLRGGSGVMGSKKKKRVKRSTTTPDDGGPRRDWADGV